MSNPAPASPSKLILVVLYRVSPPDAPTLRSLQAAAGALTAADTVLVWDNSPAPASEAAFAQVSAGSPAHWVYRNTPENRPLPSVYNEATRTVPGKSFLLIFDHDSSFGADFFGSLDAAVSEAPDIDLFVPLVRQGTLIVSPGHFHYVKGRLWTRAAFGRQPSAHTVVIGSGMAIRERVLQRLGGFDERLKLYGVDSNFMLRYAKQNPWFYVMDVRFGHDMAEYQRHDPATLWRRFEAFDYASRINAGLYAWPVRMLTRLFLSYKRLRLRLRIGSADRQDRQT